jgi:ATP-dependent exoDNAse (exonuclease V) beta subunit
MDDLARTRFRTALDRNFCVIAGAGSGKTTAIVERVRELAVRDLSALRRLVVVTYTNSAAVEFKSRAKQLLLDTVGESDALIYLRALEQAYFGTIHGFCLNLIREFRSQLWLPDDLRVPTEVERDLLWEAFVTESPDLDPLTQHPVVRSLLRICTLNELLDLAKRFRPSRLLAPPTRKMPLPDPVKIGSIPVTRNALKTKQRTVEAVEAFVERLSKSAGFSPIPRRETSAKAVKEAFNDQMAPLVAWLEEAAEWFSDQLARRFRQRCMRSGILTYADQIDICIELLQQPDLLDQVRRRESIVIVDEAQDTDARMFQVFIEITRPPGETFGSWPGTGKPPLPGRFCLVGDPRQTIFERGTSNRFAQLSEHLDREHETVRFNVTYRCARGIVRRLNELFESQTVENVALGDLVAREGAPEGFVGRLPFLPEQPIDTDDELEPLVPECEMVAKWLAQRRPSGLGLNTWSDIAIVAPRHDWLTIAGEALKKYGVPFSFFRPKSSRSGIAAFAWPVSLIYTLLRPWDKFERYGVLREVFGVADTDLLRERKGSRDPGKTLSDAQELLESARIDLILKKSRSLLYFVERLLDRFQLSDRLISIGEEIHGLDQLRWEAAKADERGTNLEAWLEELLVLLQDFAEPSKTPAKGVELITTYSAKGLEWAWVIPIGLRKKFSYRNERYPKIEAGESSRVIWSNLSRRAGRDEDAAKAELKRLLYVMLTRTKVGLVLPTPQGDYRPGRQGTAFNEVVPDDGIDLPLADELIPLPEPVEESRPHPDQPRSDERRVQIAVRPASVGPQPPRLIRPHQLADDSPVLHLQFAEAAGSYDYGKWWHSWIEMFPWDGGPERWQDYANTAVPPTFYRQRASKEIAALLANAELRQLCENAIWSQAEFPFSWPKTTEDWYEGVIDLLIGRSDGALYIVDWKTNQAALNESLDQLADHLRTQYLPQLESYREALQTIMNNQKIEIGIYSTVLGKFV